MRPLSVLQNYSYVLLAHALLPPSDCKASQSRVKQANIKEHLYRNYPATRTELAINSCKTECSNQTWLPPQQVAILARHADYIQAKS